MFLRQLERHSGLTDSNIRFFLLRHIWANLLRYQQLKNRQSAMAMNISLSTPLARDASQAPSSKENYR